MKKAFLCLLAVVAAICASLGVLLSGNDVDISYAATTQGITPTFSTTKYLLSADGTNMLLATGINDFDDCYECGYVTDGMATVNFNTAKYYTSISTKGGKSWDSEDIFGDDYSGMIVWEVKNTSTETSFKPYVKVGDRQDGMLVSSDRIEYGTEKTVSGKAAIPNDPSKPFVLNDLSDYVAGASALEFDLCLAGDDDELLLRLADDFGNYYGTYRINNSYSGFDNVSFNHAGVYSQTLSGENEYHLIFRYGEMTSGGDLPSSITKLIVVNSLSGVRTSISSGSFIRNVTFVDPHADAVQVSAAKMLSDFTVPVSNFAGSGKALTFEYKATGSSSGTDTIVFSLWGGAGGTWSPRLTDTVTINVVSNTASVGLIESEGDGWYKYKVNLSDMPLNTGTANGTETVRKLYFNTVNHAFLLDGVGFIEDPHSQAVTVSGAKMLADFVEPVSDFANSGYSLTFEYKAAGSSSGTDTVVFSLWGGSGATWSPRLTDTVTLDVVSNTASIGLIEPEEDGWYRFTVELSDMPLNAGTANGTETVRKLYFNTVNHAFLLDGVTFTNEHYVNYSVVVRNGTGSGSYREGGEVTVVADVPDGRNFVEWQIDGETVSTDLYYSFTVTDDVTLVPVFDPPMVVAVFADVQLEQENKGNTRNAYLALKNHFKYAKSVGAEVVLMSGDIVNKADETCYAAYENAIKAVYGTDESVYPEFILCMGNHEWWDSSEKESENAVSLFNRYARIETDALVKRTAITYYKDGDATLPTYYKVVNGVPFLVVSGENSQGAIGNALKAEIAGWLEEISELDSVKNGGPIYVAYHYPIPGVTYQGEATNSVCSTIDDILSDYPNAIVFTGDTHFSGVNERTINQTDYTSINIGSSSYSRNVSRSATGYAYDNVNIGTGGKNLLNGEVSYKFEYTPTIITAYSDNLGKAIVNRYFTADDNKDVKKIGITWEIDPNNFIYTDERIQNTEWANVLYGANGLTWASGETVRFNYENGKIIVRFNDVTDYNCAEHYRIKVACNYPYNIFYYDFTGSYYKFDGDSHTYHFILDDIPYSTGYSLTVTAYDFFDNPSLNVLSANKEDETLLFPDEIDVQATNTYCDASKRLNYDVTAAGSNSSLEYYYRGISSYTFGMGICQLIYRNNESLVNYLSVTDWSDATLTFKVKNPNEFDIYLGLALVVYDENGAQKWLDDFKGTKRIKIDAGSDWTCIELNIPEEYDYPVTAENIIRIGLKAAADPTAVDTENGYEMTFYLDDIDIING